MPEFTLENFVPGGILPNDQWHILTCDDTCSRCRKPIREDEIPLMIWSGNGKNMLCYCEHCTGREGSPDHELTVSGDELPSIATLGPMKPERPAGEETVSPAGEVPGSLTRPGNPGQ